MIRCLRCHRPIESYEQVCKSRWGWWRCVPDNDKTVLRVDGLLIKTGDDANPVPILEDYYEG